MNKLGASLFSSLWVVFSLLSITFVANAQDVNGIPQAQTITNNDIEEILVHTKLADYLFSTQGGNLRSIYLHFAPLGAGKVELIPGTLTDLNPDTSLLDRSYVDGALFPFTLYIDGSSTADLIFDYTIEETADQQLSIQFTAEQSGLLITKTFSIDQNPYYSFDHGLQIDNTSGAPIDLPQGIEVSLGRGVGQNNATPESLKFLYGNQVRAQPFNAPGFRGLGFRDAGLILFLRALDGDDEFFPLADQASQQQITSLGLETSQISLATGQAKSYLFRFFGGRDKYSLLESEGIGALNPPGFFIQFIIPVVELLRWLYDMTGNYGWAIIIFTILIRILLFPLTRKQFHSMSKMAAIRPKFEKIQQRYPTMRRLKELHPNMSQEELFKRDRENRAQLQQKMMALYKEEGVNPLGGCLPMLAQLPIILILWQAVLYSAELIHFTPGFLWMNDLALRDPTYIIVGLTVIAMFFQTKTTPTMTAPGQSGPNPMVMMAISAAIMVFFLRDFPAGLWLYYFLTTLVQVIQQVIIVQEMKRKEAEAMATSGEAIPSSASAEENGSEPQEPGADGSTNGKKVE